MGVIVHGQGLYGMSFLDNFKHGANITIEAVHRVLLKEFARRGYLPRIFYLQLDNTTKQCKSQYICAFLGCLVGWEVFDEVVVALTPRNHMSGTKRADDFDGRRQVAQRVIDEVAGQRDHVRVEPVRFLDDSFQHPSTGEAPHVKVGKMSDGHAVEPRWKS